MYQISNPYLHNNSLKTNDVLYNKNCPYLKPGPSDFIIYRTSFLSFIKTHVTE